jgi:integrase/recombinase XerD
VGGSPNTERAKRKDLEKFLAFFVDSLGHEHVDAWTPSVTKGFQRSLQHTVSVGRTKPLAPSSINRILATVRHFAKWLHHQRPIRVGNPLENVRDIATDSSAWNGLTDKEIMRLKSACDQRLKHCDRKNQNPLLETAVLYCLLYTGMREFELSSLNVGQYHSGGFHLVKRKGNKVSRKVPLPKEASRWLDAYLEQRGDGGSALLEDDEPLFVSRYGNRLHPRDIYRIMERICSQASAQLSEGEKMRLTPHMLRHTFLKRVADKKGVHVAQEMSGNVNMREIFRYTKPSQEEMDQIAESIL